MLFDFHTHCYSDSLAPRAMSIVPKNTPFGPFFDGTLDGLINFMKKSGVDKALTLHHASSKNSVKNVNDWAIECQKRENIYAFGSIHPDYCDYKSEIRRLKENGIKGLKFHPHYQHFFCDDREAYKIYEFVAKEDMIMVFHCGNDLLLKGDYCPPHRFCKLVNDFKGAKLVGAHLGGCFCWKEAFDLLLGKDLYLDTSFAFRFLDDNLRKRLIEEHSHSRLLFGTDAPFVEVESDLSLIYKYFPPQSLDSILHKNAENLLKISF